MSMMDHYQQYGVATAFVSPLYILTMIAGSLGNGLIIYSYVTDNSIRKTFYFLITNLAIADLFFFFSFFFFFFNCNTKNTTLQNKTNTTYNTTYKTLLILLTI